MSFHSRSTNSPPKTLQAEFDLIADEYDIQHRANIAISGEGPEYFAEYKVADLARLITALNLPDSDILDFGSGVGNSLPHFRRYFPASRIYCADVSARSLEIAMKRFPGAEPQLRIDGGIPLADSSLDVVFSACVFHHIPHEEHHFWLAELLRVTRPGGLLAIFEHNPLNPLTRHAVNTCPFDANARLIRSGQLRTRARTAGWSEAQTKFKLFFPAALRRWRPLERQLGWLPLGAQYCLAARRTK